MLRYAKISAVVISVIGLAALAPQSVQAGVLLDFSLDNSTVSGTTVADLSGNGYNGTIVTTYGPVTTGVPGALNEAFWFEGGRIHVSPGPVLVGNVPFTLAFWIKTEDTANKYVLNNETYNQWGVLLNWSGAGGGPGTIAIWNLNNLTGTDSAITLLENNTWEHVAWTYDGAKLVKYHNGVQQSEYSNPNIAFAYPNTTWRFGESGLGGGFIGGLDEIRIYSNALSASEVAALATIPEPSAMALAVLGLIGLLAYAWRKRR